MLLERLRNDITRLAAVRAFSTLAAAAPVAGDRPLDLAAAGVLEPVLAEMTSFLRRALRPLRLAALLALEVRLEHHAHDEYHDHNNDTSSMYTHVHC